MQVGAGQAAALPEALQESARSIAIPAAQAQQPAIGPALPLARADQGQADLGTEPAGQLAWVIEAGGRKSAIAQLGQGLAGGPALAGGRHGPGITQGLLAIGEQEQAQGRLARHEAGGQRHRQGALAQLQRRAVEHQPPGAASEAQQHQGQRQ